MADRIQFRRDTAARWSSINPILMEGEIGLETDTNHIKIGNGSSAWNNLEYGIGMTNITSEYGGSTSLAASQKLACCDFLPLDTTLFYNSEGLLNDGKVVSEYCSYRTFTIDLQKYQGKTVYFFGTRMADGNGYWDLYVITHSDGSTTVVKNDISNNPCGVKIDVPSDALYLKASTSGGCIFIWDGSYKIYPRKRYPNLYNVPIGAEAKVDDSVNLLTGTTWSEGYLDYRDGKAYGYATYHYSDYIDVSTYDTIILSAVIENSGVFYDEDKNYLEGVGENMRPKSYGIEAKVPINAKYFRFNAAKKDIYAYVIDKKQIHAQIAYPWLNTFSLQVPKTAMIGTQKGYMASDGTINTYIASGGTIQKYDISNIKSYIKLSYVCSLSIGTTPQWCVAWIVDENNTPIRFYTVDYCGLSNSALIIQIPEGGKQLWVQPLEHSVWVNPQGDEDFSTTGIANNQWGGKKIVWLGTSIPYGQCLTTDETPYPMQIASKLDCTVINVARPGMAIETTSDYKCKAGGSLSLTIDELTAQGRATTPFMSYENAMLGQDADLYVFDCEPNNSNWDLTALNNFSVHNWSFSDGSTFVQNRNSYVGALLFLLDKLWTEKPSAKVVLVSEFIRGANLDAVYEGIAATQAVADKLRIPFIKIGERLYFTPKNKSLYLSSDNVHPIKAGHDRIANILAHELLTIS